MNGSETVVVLIVIVVNIVSVLVAIVMVVVFSSTPLVEVVLVVVLVVDVLSTCFQKQSIHVLGAYFRHLNAGIDSMPLNWTARRHLTTRFSVRCLSANGSWTSSSNCPAVSGTLNARHMS